MSSRLPAAVRREQLLDVALGVFAREGFHGASMNEVADAAGVTKPVLYQHFSSKRELYLALLDEAGQRLFDRVSKATSAAGTPHEQVELGFGAYFAWVHEDRASFLLLFGGGARRDEEFAEALRRVEDGMATAIAPLINADIDQQHQEILAYGLVGLAESTGRRLVKNDSDFDPVLVGRQVADLAWAGLRTVRRV